MNKLIGNTIYLNPESHLPPVDCPLLIELQPGTLVRAHRENYVKRKDDTMAFRLQDGSEVHGRFRWTYP